MFKFPKMNKKKTIKIAVILLVVAGLGAGGYYTYKRFAAATMKQGSSREQTVRVAKGNLDVSISGTGTVQPIARYDIVPLVKGSIINAPFEEGADVKAGDLLYRIDDSDITINIEKAQNNIEKLRLNNQTTAESIKNLIVYAPIDGQLGNFTLSEGDQVNNNAKIGDLINFKKLTTVVSFNENQTKKIQVGQKVQVMVSQYLTSVEGVVKYIGNTSKPVNGSVMCDVEVAFDNPGAITEGTEVSVIIKSAGGDIISPVAGKVTYADKKQIQAKSSGEVVQVLVKNGDWVKAGQKIMVLKNDSLMVTEEKNSLDLRESELSLDAQVKQMDNYNILSPISGKIIKKNYKAGDTISNANNSTILMVVADLSKMIFTIDVDELDVSKIAVGQKVAVTADALPGTNIAGQVTGTSLEGKTQNGVTTYPIQVTINDPGKLRPGMNVNAKIVVESKTNALYLPMAAVTKVGNRAYVNLKEEAGGNSVAAGGSGQQGAQQGAGNNNTAGSGNRPTGSARPEGAGAARPEGAGSARPGGAAGAGGGGSGPTGGSGQQGVQQAAASGSAGTGGAASSGNQGASQSAVQGAAQGTTQGSAQQSGNGSKSTAAVVRTPAAAPGNTQRREVVVGINNENFIEIVSGLNEGDVVVLPTVSTNTSANTGGGMPGGMGNIRLPMGGGR